MTNKNIPVLFSIILTALFIVFYQTEDNMIQPIAQEKEPEKRQKNAHQNPEIQYKKTATTKNTKQTKQNQPIKIITIKNPDEIPENFTAQTDTFFIKVSNRSNNTNQNATFINAQINNQPFQIQVPKDESNPILEVQNQVTNESKSIKLTKEAIKSKNLNINFDTQKLNFSQEQDKIQENSVIPF